MYIRITIKIRCILFIISQTKYVYITLLIYQYDFKYLEIYI